MASPERREKDKELLQQELEKTIQKPILPETIQAMRDGRTRCTYFPRIVRADVAKWGVSKSFAAVDWGVVVGLGDWGIGLALGVLGL